MNAETASPSSVDITDYVAVIRRHWKLVVACGLGLMVLALLYSFTRPTVYVSRAQIALPESAVRAATSRSTIDTATELEVLKSESVAILAAKKLDTTRSISNLRTHLTASAPTEGRVLAVSFTDNSARAAQRGAEAFTDAYVEYRTSQTENDIDSRADAAQAKIDAVEQTINGLEEELDKLENPDSEQAKELIDQIGRYRTSGAPTSPAGHDPAAEPCRRRRSSPRRSCRADRSDPAWSATGSSDSWAASSSASGSPSCGTASTSRSARAPTCVASPGCRASAPSRCSRSRCGTRRSRSSRSTRRKRPRPTRSAGSAPRSPSRPTRPAPRPSSSRARWPARASPRWRPTWRSRSSRAAAGCCSSPRTCAGRWSRTCSRCRASPGLVEVLAREVPLEETLHGVGRLTVLPSGRHHNAATDLLQAPTMRTILQQAKTSYDVTIIDTPPVLAVADVLGLASMVDGIVMVVAVAETSEAQVVDAADQLRASGGTLLGVVLNRSGGSAPQYYDQYRRPGGQVPS